MPAIVKPDLSFYNVDRENLLYTKPIKKRLSSNVLNYDYPDDKYHEIAHRHLIKNFYSLFNFVSRESTPNLFVNPDTSTSSNSYVENRIQLGTKPLFDVRFSQQHRIDMMIAITIHKMWHKRYTNRDISSVYIKPAITIQEFYGSKQAKDTIKKILPNKIIGELFNILEDRRIEKLGLEEFPGFVFYFDKLREYCIELHSEKKTSDYMLSSLIMEYVMFRILLPELLDFYMNYVNEVYKSLRTKPKFSKKMLFEVMSYIDKYIHANQTIVYSDRIEDLLIASKAIYNLLPKDMRVDLERDITGAEKNFSGVFSDYVYDNDSDCAIQQSEETIGKISDDIISEIEKQEKKRDNTKTPENENDKSRTEKIDIINCAEGVFDEVIIYNPICKDVDKNLYGQAKKIAGNMAMSLGFLAARLNQINQSFEQVEGEIDEDELYSISFSKNIFYEDETRPGFELDFGILIDESGSMNESEGVKRINAMIAALGCILAIKDSRYINLFVYGHSQGRHFAYTDKKVELYEYINSKRRVTDWKNVFSVGAKGGNADGYAIAKMGEIMLSDSACKNKILVVISDGLPCAHDYGNSAAEQHVRYVVDILAGKGIETIQICIDNIENSGNMFKNFIPFDSMGNFIKEFGNILKKKLTKFSENY